MFAIKTKDDINLLFKIYLMQSLQLRVPSVLLAKWFQLLRVHLNTLSEIFTLYSIACNGFKYLVTSGYQFVELKYKAK